MNPVYKAVYKPVNPHGQTCLRQPSLRLRIIPIHEHADRCDDDAYDEGCNEFSYFKVFWISAAEVAEHGGDETCEEADEYGLPNNYHFFTSQLFLHIPTVLLATINTCPNDHDTMHNTDNS